MPVTTTICVILGILLWAGLKILAAYNHWK